MTNEERRPTGLLHTADELRTGQEHRLLHRRRGGLYRGYGVPWRHL